MSNILIRGMEMPKDIEPGLVIEFADGIDGKRYARLYHYRHGGLTEWLEAISAADVRPVALTKAILKDDGRAHCSGCDCPVNSHSWHYCPNCGADMEGS